MAEDTSQPSIGQQKRKKDNGDQLQVKRKAYLSSESVMEGVQRYFLFIKKEVSSDWKDLAFLLGFGRADRDNIAGRNRDDKSCCMDLLEEWLKRNGERATIQVLMEALSEAELQSTVDGLKNKYPELRCLHPVLRVHAQLGVVYPQTSDQGQAGDISIEPDGQTIERLRELEKKLVTPEVLMDPEVYWKVQQALLKHKTFLIDYFGGCVILLLMFLRQTDVDRFYHNHYRVGEGSLSQQLSGILISEHLQDKVKGAQLIVRLQVKHGDYLRVRNRLGQGLDRTTSLDNILALPPPNGRVDQSSVRGLDLATINGEDQSCRRGTTDVTTRNLTVKEVQTALQKARDKSQQQMEGRLQVTQGELETERQESKTLKMAVTTLTQEKEKAQKIVLEQKIENQQLRETNTANEERIEKMRKEIQNAKDQAEAIVQSLRKKVTRLTEEKEEDQKTLQKQNVEIQQILETNKNREIKIDELTDNNTKLREKDETSQKVLSEQKLKIHELQETNKSKEDKIERIQQQIYTARQQTESMVQSLRKGATRLEQEKEEAQKILQQQKIEIQQLQEVNKSMAIRIEDLLSAKQPVEGKGLGGGHEREEDSEKEETKTGLEDQAIGNVNQADSEVTAVDRFYGVLEEGDVPSVRSGSEGSVTRDWGEKDLSKQAKQEKLYHELMQQSGGVKVNRLKVILGGMETNGRSTLKTSLTKGLLSALIERLSRRSVEESAEEPYDPTPGLDVGTFHVPGVGEVSVWDFAGQAEYAVTHSMFMDAENTVFIVLYNITDDSETQEKQVHWWLCFIKACNPYRQPDVILVASHADKVTPARGLRRAAHVIRVMQTEFRDHLRIADEVILMDCRETCTPEMDKLKALLVRIKDALLQHQRDMPRLCAEIMKRLPEWCKKTSPRFPVMTWHQYVEEVRKLDRLVDEDFLQKCTRYLHYLAEVLFITPATSDPVLVLKPNWLGTDVFGPIMAPDKFPIPRILRKRRDYVTRAEIQEVFQDVADVDLLITLLQEFQLCHSYNGREFIFPGLLTQTMPSDKWQPTQEPKVVYFGKQVQCADSTDMFSSGFFPRVQTRLMRELENPPQLWRDGAKSADKDVEGLIKLSPDGRAVNICVRSAQGDKVQCGKMLQQLENIIADVLYECSPGTGTVENVLSARALKEHMEEFYSYSKEEISKAAAEGGTVHHPTLGFMEQVSDLLCREDRGDYLHRRRSKLVQTIRDVEPLLDHLQTRDVLSTEECNIIRSKPTPQERARALLDTVRVKGANARQVFKAVLGEVYPDALESTA